MFIFELLYITNVFLEDVFCTLWMSQRRLLNVMYVSRRLLNVMNVSKMSFDCYGCLKRCLLNVMDVSKTSFECYECLKDVF